MGDPQMAAFMNVPMPFDHKRMLYAGFTEMVRG
jgi:uncharacterized protein YbaA (DUF1428 family)